MGATLASRPSVRAYQSDVSALERSLREAVGAVGDSFSDEFVSEAGSLSQDAIATWLLAPTSNMQVRPSEELESRLAAWVERVNRTVEHDAGLEKPFKGKFPALLQREFGARPERLDRLHCFSPEDGLDVKYSRDGLGKKFEPIEYASAGQRAASMLAFLLSYGAEPLVLDQPEDDLDNHLIYDLVVRQLRENKTRRQLIVVTHNPNIVVNGDAEMIHVLGFHEGQCMVMQRGSLQDGEVRDEVCRVMEGGAEAFERRYRRLGGSPR